MFVRPIILLFAFPLASALLLFLAWPPISLTALAFCALVPLLVLGKLTNSKPLGLFIACFIGFFVFHLLAAWWMYSSTIIGSLLAHLFNSFYMAVVILLTQLISKKWPTTLTYILAFPALWLAMEFLHFHWELSWPWFTLGHVFAEHPAWVQWYSYTGSMGGSLWVLVVNGLLAVIVKIMIHTEKLRLLHFGLAVIGLIFIPLLISNWLTTAKTTDARIRVLIVQPNIDPRVDKFGGMTQQEQYDVVEKLLASRLSSDIELLVLPETMITIPIDEDSLEVSTWIDQLRTFSGGKNHIPILTGAFTKRSSNIPAKDKRALIEKGNQTYVLYNSALLIEKNRIQVYHKTQLVPLVEKQPFYHLMKPIRDFIEKSGGFFGRYGTHNDHFAFEFGETSIVPLICFESAYGGYTASSVSRQQAGFIVLITNDGWWSTPGGYRQHLAYASLRAIETGRYIVRAANTGISATINPSGLIENSMAYATEGILIADIGIQQELTCYSKHGDYIGLLALGLSVIILSMAFLKDLNVRFGRRRQ
jgi:apolipoprotein N-acyltransferase